MKIKLFGVRTTLCFLLLVFGSLVLVAQDTQAPSHTTAGPNQQHRAGESVNSTSCRNNAN